jgi:hypothetical protein
MQSGIRGQQPCCSCQITNAHCLCSGSKDKKKGDENGDDADSGEGGSDERGDDEDGDESDGGGDANWKTDMSEAAVARRQREQLTAAAASLVQAPAVVRPTCVLRHSKAI